MEPKSEVDKLFEEMPEVSVMEQNLEPEIKEQEQVVPEDDIESPKTRYQRRLKRDLDAERESNIALAAKVEVLTEAQRLQKETEPSEYLKKVERIYGTDSPEATAATQLLSEALTGLEERATERALKAIREEQAKAQEATQKEERTLDSFIEQIEDEHNVTFTPEMEKGYFQLMEKLSPKDNDGNIIAYADPESTWELYKERTKKENPSKAIASRAMSQGGTSGDSKLQDDAMQRALREAGIL
jgi:hypothetical protein